MPTINDNQIVVDGARDLLKASMKLHTEVLERDPYIALLRQFNVINYHPELTAKAGSTVTIYNSPRLSAKGVVGDHDRYSNATPLTSGDRTVQIRLFSKTVNYALDGSERQQISEFDLKARAPQLLSDYMKSYMLATLMNQLGGNTANSIDASDVADTAYTGSDLTIITGQNAALAPSARYKAIGALGAGGVTADENVDADNVLKLADIQAAREVIMSTASGVPSWNRIKRRMQNKQVDAICFVSTTGMNQLKQDAKATGNNYVFSELIYANLAGGKDMMTPAGSYIVDGIMLVEVPDNILPRGVNSSSSAPVANTRRCVIMGMDAIDLAAGKGFAIGDRSATPFELTIDDDYMKMNKIGYASVGVNMGCKKVQIFGTGSNASTRYDLATYVITHYSRT